MNVLAVIPCLNEEANLERLVTQLATCGVPMRIVIADGGSADRSAQIARELAARFPDVHLLHNQQRLQSAGINLAVETYGRGFDTLLRIDAHADYPDDYCRILLEEAAARRADSVVVAMETVGHGGFQDAVAAAQNSRLGNGGSAHRMAKGEGKWVEHGHHALMRLDAFRAAGGYDPGFSHNEDAELDHRLRLSGRRIWLTARTTLRYHPRATAAGLWKQYFRYGKGRARTLLKHRLRPRPRQMLPVCVAPALLLALATPVICLAALPLLAWAGLCLAYGAWLGIQSGKPAVLLSGVAAMVMHLAWSLGFWQGIVTKGRA